MDTDFIDLIPIVLESQVVAAMIEPDGEVFAVIRTHDPAHLLNVAGE